MLLVKCPECGSNISDKAITCPHCGYPLTLTNKIKRKTRTKSKRRRLPNGFGQISKIKGENLRKPYRAMVTVGKNSKGRPVCKLLKPNSYFSTYNEAYEALMEYHKNPYDLDAAITVYELYEKWTDYYFKTLKNDSSIRTVTSAWRYCSSVYDMRACDLRARHIKSCMENGTAKIKGEERHATSGVKSRIKSMFNLMLDYALEYEIVDRNYARTFNLSDEIVIDLKKSQGTHFPFNSREIDLLWENVNNIRYVDVMLIQCYSGWRPQELGLIKLEDVDIDNWMFKGGMKTEFGKNRIVPIHSKIRSLVMNRYEEAKNISSDYLLNCTDGTTHRSSIKLTYDKYYARVRKIIDKLDLNPEHKPHDGRVTFITMAKNSNVDEYAIKYMVGHQINDITEKVYTKREIEWLCTEIEKIK